MDKEIKRIITDEEHLTEANYPFTIKPNLSTLGSLTEISPQRSIISIMFDHGIRDPIGFIARTVYEKVTYHPIPSIFDHLTKFF